MLQQQASQQKAALEQQAMQLTMDFQQKKAEETMQMQQYEMERQQADMQTRIQGEMQKLGVSSPFGNAPQFRGAPQLGQPQMQFGATSMMAGQPPQGAGPIYMYGPNGELIPKEQ